MITVGINGMGRVGRALFRILAETSDIQVTAVNDRASPDNLAYLLANDSIYGRFGHDVGAIYPSGKANLTINRRYIPAYSAEDISAVPWGDCQIVVDASGDARNVSCAQSFAAQGPRVIVTHSPVTGIDSTIIAPEVIECDYDPEKHKVISSSICDAVAIAPVLEVIDRQFVIKQAWITTLHPWLDYQRLSDGHTQDFYWRDDFQLGRAAASNLIPKPTTLVHALRNVLPDVASRTTAMSFRIPTPIVCAAELFLVVETMPLRKTLAEILSKAAIKYPAIIAYSNNCLASTDVKGSTTNCIIDRWLEIQGDILRIVLWYDNEWGYASHITRLIRFIAQ